MLGFNRLFNYEVSSKTSCFVDFVADDKGMTLLDSLNILLGRLGVGGSQ